MAGTSHNKWHNAFWCRRAGVPCVPLRRAGVCAVAVMVAVLVSVALCPASARAVPCGSIIIEARYGQGAAAEPISGDTWRLAQVAAATLADNGALVYTATEAFSSFDRDWAALSASELREAARELGAYAQEHDLLTYGAAVADASGRALFEGVAPGLYLAARTDVAGENQTVVCDPVLVSVPLYEDGSWVFNVTAAPKFEGSDNPSGNQQETPEDKTQEPADTAGGLLRPFKLPQMGDWLSLFALLAIAVAALLVAGGWLLRRRTLRKASAPTRGGGPSSAAADQEPVALPDQEPARPPHRDADK